MTGFGRLSDVVTFLLCQCALKSESTNSIIHLLCCWRPNLHIFRILLHFLDLASSAGHKSVSTGIIQKVSFSFYVVPLFWRLVSRQLFSSFHNSQHLPLCSRNMALLSLTNQTKTHHPPLVLELMYTYAHPLCCFKFKVLE